LTICLFTVIVQVKKE